MPSANEQLLDQTLSHQIGIRRLSVGEVNKIIEDLEKREARLVRDIARELKKLGITGLSQSEFIAEAQMKPILELIHEFRRQYFQELYHVLANDLEDLANYEAVYTADMVRRSVPGWSALPIELAAVAPDVLRGLVRSQPFQGKLLRDHIRKLAKKDGLVERKLTKVLKEGLLEGQPLLTMVRKARAVFPMEQRAMTAIIHTAIHHVTGSVRDEWAKANADIIQAQKWVATLDTRTCVICAARDGYLYDPVTHEPLDGGPPWDAGPGRMHFNDRCDSVTTLKRWDELGIDPDKIAEHTRASMDGHIAASVKAEDWLSTRTDAQLVDIFGKQRAAMFRSGALSVRDMLGPKGLQPLSLADLWAAHADELLAEGFTPSGFPGAVRVRKALGL